MAANFDSDNGEVPGFFNMVLEPFPDLEDGKIKTNLFIRSVRAIVEAIGKIADLELVVNDMNRNVERIAMEHITDTELFEYLEDMVLIEKQDGGYICAEACLWLKRGLHLLSSFLRAIYDDFNKENKTEDLGNLFRVAYETSLKSFHLPSNQDQFEKICQGLPTRSLLFYILGLQGHNEETVMEHLRKFLVNMEANVEALDKIFAGKTWDRFPDMM